MAPNAVDDETVVSPPLVRQRTENDGEKDRDRLRKAVSYAESDSVSPMMLGKSKEVDEFNLDRHPRQHRAKLAKRLSGRMINPLGDTTVPFPALEENTDDNTSTEIQHHHHRLAGMIEEISAWIHEERSRRTARKERRKQKAANKAEEAGSDKDHGAIPASSLQDTRRASDSSESSTTTALEKLESIVKKSPGRGALAKVLDRKGSTSGKRRSSIRKLRRQSTASSDTEGVDGDAIVPSCDAILDNSKTMSYLGGVSASQADGNDAKSAAAKDKEAWLTFKFEIVRLAHTLKLKGWRQVPMDRSGDIDVERLSGALTNAVYVVAPPPDLSTLQAEEDNGTSGQGLRRIPPKLLLRIYGPQVEHLIDREIELQILRRLARQKIGPRLLGTFTNGRFEEFFHARTLKPQDLRCPDTSKQIAKRMRELHDGIELLIEERNGGPSVWKNWDKWVERCERIMSYIDEEKIPSGCFPSSLGKKDFICGAPWQTFRKTVEKYRAWLDEQYGGPEKLNEHMVFAHNDTQYGNILRLEPPGESPLVLPANKHKQLIVIDFEYANANMAGYEFANHFTEWCYNYHDPTHAWACNTAHYPTIEERQRFIRAYVGHRPQVSRAASTSPKPLPRDLPQITSTLVGSPLPMPTQSVTTTAINTAKAAVSTSLSSLSSLSLHRRHRSRQESDNPYFPSSLERTESTSSQFGDEGDKEDSPEVAAEIGRLMLETRLWRTANSTQWVLWGLVQASLPGFAAWERRMKAKSAPAAGKEIKVEQFTKDGKTIDGGSDPLNEETKQSIADLHDRRPDSLGGGGGEEVDGFEVPSTSSRIEEVSRSEGAKTDAGAEAKIEEETEKEEGEEPEEFNCLAYSRDRALFFWGDCLQLGFVEEGELREWGIWEEVKVVAV